MLPFAPSVVWLFTATAWADPWALSEPVLRGDGVAPGTAVAIEDVVINDTDGLVTLRACCGLTELAACTDSSTYDIAWTLDRDVHLLERGDSVGIALSNVRTSGTCAEIDPTVVVAGDNGNPADSLPGLGVTFDGPVGIFDDALSGGRFYPTNSEAHTDHDGSLRVVSVMDAETMLDDGYFHLDIAHRWGLQYEITWLYGAAPAGSAGCHHAGSAVGVAGLLPLLGLRRRRGGAATSNPRRRT